MCAIVNVGDCSRATNKGHPYTPKVYVLPAATLQCNVTFAHAFVVNTPYAGCDCSAASAEWLHSSYGRGWHVPHASKAVKRPTWHNHLYHSEQTDDASIKDPPDTLGKRFWCQVSAKPI